MFAPGTVELSFAAGKRFLERHRAIRLRLGRRLDRKMVDFFVNSLFFSQIVEYAGDFHDGLKVTQTGFPMSLDDLDEG